MSVIESIRLGDIVYQKKSGWSGYPMKVLELKEVSGKHGVVAQAVCTNSNGLFSEKHGTRVETYAVANLTLVPDSAWK